MASNYRWTGGNILLSLGGGGGPKKYLDIFLGGGPEKMEIQFQVFTPPPPS